MEKRLIRFKNEINFVQFRLSSFVITTNAKQKKKYNVYKDKIPFEKCFIKILPVICSQFPDSSTRFVQLNQDSIEPR